MADYPIFVKPLALGTITSGNEASGFPATNLGKLKAPGLTWQSSGATNLWVRGDLGTVQDIDFCAIISANAIAATTFRLRLGDNQTEVDGTADYDSSTQTFINPSITRDDELYHSFWELDATYTKRWWRIDIGSHSGDFEAAFVILGKKIQLSRFYDFDYEFGIEDSGGGDINRYGVWDDVPGQILRTLDMTLNWMTEAEVETSIRPLLEAVGTSQPVYCCFDPTSNTYRQNRTFYGKFKKAPYARGRRKVGTYGGEFQLLSVV